MKHPRQGRSVKGDEDGRCENQLIGRAGARFGGDEEGKKLGEMSKGKRGDWGGLEEEGQEQNEEKSGVSPVARREREEKKSESESESESELEERKLPEKNNDDCEPRVGYECVV